LAFAAGTAPPHVEGLAFVVFVSAAFLGLTTALFARRRIETREELVGKWVTTLAILVNGAAFFLSVIVFVVGAPGTF
jgi:hypothetical protein